MHASAFRVTPRYAEGGIRFPSRSAAQRRTAPRRAIVPVRDNSCRRTGNYRRHRELSPVAGSAWRGGRRVACRAGGAGRRVAGGGRGGGYEGRPGQSRRSCRTITASRPGPTPIAEMRAPLIASMAST